MFKNQKQLQVEIRFFDTTINCIMVRVYGYGKVISNALLGMHDIFKLIVVVL